MIVIRKTENSSAVKKKSKFKTSSSL